MAILSRAILGNISGSIAGLTFRRAYGKVLIVNKRSSYTTPVDPDSVCRRNVFGFTCKLASVINSQNILHGFWQAAVPKHLTVFHTIVKSIFKTMEAGTVTSQTKLAPGAGWNFSCMSFSCTASQIELTTDCPRTSIKTGVTGESSLLLIAVPVFTSPLEQSSDAFLFDALVSEPQAITADQPLNFVVPLSELLSQWYEQYRIRKTLLIVVTLDDAGKPLRHSNTILKEES
jgi:hypothetical protein